MLPPTSHLPPIKSIKATALGKLQSSIDYLWMIYNPPVRGSLRRSKHTSLPSSAPDLQLLRTDSFERDYSMKWLTALISQLGSAGDEAGRPHHDAHIALLHEKLINSAASLLATCAGTASAGAINRTFVFNTSDDRFKGSSRIITVELKDVPLDNHDYRSVGAQTWGSACIMADMIAESPQSFGIPCFLSGSAHGPFSFRCLELGAGTGLVSLTVAKIIEPHLHALKNDSADLAPALLPDIEIIPSDYYPTVIGNLERNIQANFMETSPLQIHSQPLDWSVFSVSETTSDPAVLQKRFDVIYGADIVYEARHAEWIKGCLLKLLRKPELNINEDPAFHLIIPLRRTHTAESDTIERVFETRGNGQNKRGDRNLIIKHKEIIICESETGSNEDVEYVYYRIGWETKSSKVLES